MSTTEQILNSNGKKSPVRWKDEDILKIKDVLPKVINEIPERDPVRWIDVAQKRVLPEDRWRRLDRISQAPAALLMLLQPRFPELKKFLVEADKDGHMTDVANRIVEERLRNPFDVFIDCYNAGVLAHPEAKLTEIQHSKHAKAEIMVSVEARCLDLLQPVPPVEPPKPDLAGFPSGELLSAYHISLMQEILDTVEGDRMERVAHREKVAELINRAESTDVQDDVDDKLDELELRLRSQIDTEIGALVDMLTVGEPKKEDVIKRLQEVKQKLRDAHDADPSPARTKIKIVIVDQIVSRNNPSAFKESWAGKVPGRYKLKFDIRSLDGKDKGTPGFPSEHSFAILTESIPAKWKDLAWNVMGHDRVFIIQNSAFAVDQAMQVIVEKLSRNEIA